MFSKITAMLNVTLENGANCTLTIENMPGPDDPDQIGSYIGRHIQQHWDRLTDADGRKARVEMLARKLDELNAATENSSAPQKDDQAQAMRKRRGRPPKIHKEGIAKNGNA